MVGAGEPLNPEIIDQIRKAWALQLRDGYGQTETTAQVGNSPGLLVSNLIRQEQLNRKELSRLKKLIEENE